MNAETKFALIGSIKKWQDIAAGTGEDLGSKNCPLCQRSGWLGCRGCPVAIKTGRAFCSHTPYEAWIQHINEVHYKHTGKAECRTCRFLAKQEVKFLKKLLDDEVNNSGGNPKQSKGDKT